MVARGYAVLLPDPGLSTGYGHEFVGRGYGEWGPRPYADLMAITDATAARPDSSGSARRCCDAGLLPFAPCRYARVST